MRTRTRGSALLFTLLASMVGSVVLGLAIDTAALLAVRAQLQTAGALAADSISLEKSDNAGASTETLEKAARNSLDKNGFPWATITLDAESVKIRHNADVFFLRMIRTEPIPVEVRIKL